MRKLFVGAVPSLRQELIDRIVANSDITRAQAEKFTTRDLHVVANGLDAQGHTEPAHVATHASDAEKIAAMQPKGIVAHFAAKKGSRR